MTPSVAEARIAGETISPRTEEEVAAAVAAACSAGRPLSLTGRGSLAGLGRPVAADAVLDLSGLDGVTLYEPEELVLSARAGTPLAGIVDMLKAHNQMLAFEPPDLGPLLGGAAGQGSFGGLYATNLAGPRRISHGAVRDHALGVRAVSGRGELFKSGGRVVKNVTGYDLPRLIAGSYGTLAAVTEVTLKVLPAPAESETVLLPGLGWSEAARAMSAAMGSSCEVSGAAYVPAALADRLPGVPDAAVLLRLEGVAPSVAARGAMLEAVLRPFGATARLTGEASRALWAAVRDVAPFVGTDGVVWRISTAPAAGPDLAGQLAESFGGVAFCDWAGGLVWLSLPGPDSSADKVRAALAPHGGHATLVRAPAAERARVAVFQPPEPALWALTRRVKAGFDPAGVLNPGRMHGGL